MAKRKKGEIVFDVKQLQQKYSNLKQMSDQKKIGSDLASSGNSEWYKILKLVLTDTNTSLDGMLLGDS